MVELMQLLIEWNAILTRIEALENEQSEQTTVVSIIDTYEPINGITYL